MEVGDVYETNNFGKLKILKYIDALHVDVGFIDTGYRTTTRAELIRKGTVADRLLPTLYGVGFLGVDEFPPTKKR